MPPLKEDNQLAREQACRRDIDKNDAERLDDPFSKRPNDVVDDFVCVGEEGEGELNGRVSLVFLPMLVINCWKGGQLTAIQSKSNLIVVFSIRMTILNISAVVRTSNPA